MYVIDRLSSSSPLKVHIHKAEERSTSVIDELDNVVDVLRNHVYREIINT